MDDKKSESTSLKQIRTFQGDVAEALQNEQRSLVSIQRAEQLKRGSIKSANNSFSERYKNRVDSLFLFLGSLILVVLGTAGIWYAYNEFVKRAATPITTAPANRFVSSNAEVNLNIVTPTTRGALIQTLTSALQEATAGEIRHIVFTKDGSKEKTYIFPINEFLEILETQAPESLLRAFDPPFMFGTLGKSNFLIIKLASFENAFAGMLAWEKNLGQDIGPLFATADLVAELSPESIFTDLTDRNKDVRVLPLRGQPVLLYSFFDNKMLIITDSVETLRVLVDRLTREKLSR